MNPLELRIIELEKEIEKLKFDIALSSWRKFDKTDRKTYPNYGERCLIKNKGSIEIARFYYDYDDDNSPVFFEGNLFFHFVSEWKGLS